MRTKHRLTMATVLVALLTTATLAQRETTLAQRQTTIERPSTGATVTAAVAADLVQFAAPGNVTSMQLEVFGPSGDKLFDSGKHDGNLLDWRWQDSTSSQLATGTTYLCVVTVHSLSGRASRKLAHLVLENQQVTLQTVDPAQIASLQALALGTTDTDTPLTILGADQKISATVVTHDGTDGGVASTTGALTFRTGDVFSGKEIERMRITPEGNVGIGTEKPTAMLEVAGTIRAERVLIAKSVKPGKADTANKAGDTAQAMDDAASPEQPLASGSGLQNRVAKWTETGGAGTLGDTQISEINGSVVVGNPSQTGNIQIYGTALQDVFAGMGTDITLGPAFNYGYAGLSFGRSAGFFNVRPDALATPPNPSLRFMTANVQRMIVTNTGSVGIGTTSPNAASKLDVVGDINTSTQYRIGGNRVFSIAGNSNTFAGLNVGIANTGGGHNSFFGSAAGVSNTTGNGNSFFGSSAGVSNTTGSDNSFFGTITGAANTVGFFNSFFGSTAGIFNTTGSDNSFFGAFAGFSNTTGGSNSFFGSSAGRDNTTGANNSFFGRDAGFQNSSGFSNSFFGFKAGTANTSGFNNAFFGDSAGQLNTIGDNNAFFGMVAGNSNTEGSRNSFFGGGAGFNSTTASDNSFFGNGAGFSNTTGANNSFFGRGAGGANTTAPFNSFFGFNAGSSNTEGFANSFFGASAGESNTTGTANSYFGENAGSKTTTGGGNSSFGWSAGGDNTTGEYNSFFGYLAGSNITTGSNNTFIGHNAGSNHPTGSNNTFIGADADAASNNLTFATAVGADAVVSSSNTIALGRADGSDTVVVPGKLQIDTLAAAGSTDLCLNGSNRVGPCSSSLRYKTQVQPFLGGLNLLNLLRPISFTWKQDGKRDLGFGAEDVATVEPLLTFRNQQGEIEGVKYSQLSAVFVNSFKEQQAQIQQQQETMRQQQIQLARQQLRLEALEQLVRGSQRRRRR